MFDELNAKIPYQGIWPGLKNYEVCTYILVL